jgi:hypothetical protein
MPAHHRAVITHTHHDIVSGRLLQVNPLSRLSAEEALQHVYFRDLQVSPHSGQPAKQTLANIQGVDGFRFERRALEVWDLRAEMLVEGVC